MKYKPNRPGLITRLPDTRFRKDAVVKLFPTGGHGWLIAAASTLKSRIKTIAKLERENAELRRKLESSEQIRAAEKKILISEIAKNVELMYAIKAAHHSEVWGNHIGTLNTLYKALVAGKEGNW